MDLFHRDEHLLDARHRECPHGGDARAKQVGIAAVIMLSPSPGSLRSPASSHPAGVCRSMPPVLLASAAAFIVRRTRSVYLSPVGIGLLRSIPASGLGSHL